MIEFTLIEYTNGPILWASYQNQMFTIYSLVSLINNTVESAKAQAAWHIHDKLEVACPSY